MIITTREERQAQLWQAKDFAKRVEASSLPVYEFLRRFEPVDLFTVALALHESKRFPKVQQAVLTELWHGGWKFAFKKAVSRKLLREMFRYARFRLPKEMPKKVTIWRGVRAPDPELGFSWFLSRDIAAYRAIVADWEGRGEKPVLLKAEVLRSNLVYYGDALTLNALRHACRANTNQQVIPDAVISISTDENRDEWIPAGLRVWRGHDRGVVSRMARGLPVAHSAVGSAAVARVHREIGERIVRDEHLRPYLLDTDRALVGVTCLLATFIAG